MQLINPCQQAPMFFDDLPVWFRLEAARSSRNSKVFEDGEQGAQFRNLGDRAAGNLPGLTVVNTLYSILRDGKLTVSEFCNQGAGFPSCCRIRSV